MESLRQIEGVLGGMVPCFRLKKALINARAEVLGMTGG
jgi:hypothetical protein